MKNNYILVLSTFLLLTMGLSAQVDIVSIGESYGQTTFYNVTTGETQSFDVDSWDIAFSNIGTTDAGVFINEGSASTGLGLELYEASTLDWNETITDVSEFISENRLLNPDEDWTQGAFNTVKEETNPFDYGWGEYNPVNHTITGTTIYVMKKRDESFVKIKFDSYADGVYTFAIADLDGSNEDTFTIAKDSDNGQGIFFYSLENKAVLDVTIDYDLIFTRYSALVFGQGVFQEYVVTGILTAPGVEVAKAEGVDPLEVEESDFDDAYTAFPREIGSDWKYFDFAAGWVIESDRAYFIKAKGGNTYKILFYDFEGSATGNTTLEKFNLGVTAGIFGESYSLLTVYPNPASDYVVFDLEQSGELDLAVYNQSGALVHQANVQGVRFDIPAEWNTGLYYFVARSKEQQFSTSILIKR